MLRFLPEGGVTSRQLVMFLVFFYVPCVFLATCWQLTSTQLRSRPLKKSIYFFFISTGGLSPPGPPTLLIWGIYNLEKRYYMDRTIHYFQDRTDIWIVRSNISRIGLIYGSYDPIFPGYEKFERMCFPIFQGYEKLEKSVFQYFQDYRECCRPQFPIFPG